MLPVGTQPWVEALQARDGSTAGSGRGQRIVASRGASQAATMWNAFRATRLMGPRLSQPGPDPISSEAACLSTATLIARTETSATFDAHITRLKRTPKQTYGTVALASRAADGQGAGRGFHEMDSNSLQEIDQIVQCPRAGDPRPRRRPASLHHAGLGRRSLGEQTHPRQLEAFSDVRAFYSSANGRSGF